MGAEAILFLNGRDPSDFPFIRKQGMQLGSKMRFLSTQFLALLESLKSANHPDEVRSLSNQLEHLIFLRQYADTESALRVEPPKSIATP